MTKEHTIHSINIDLLRSHVVKSKSAIGELEREFTGFEQHLECSNYRPTYRMNIFDQIILDPNAIRRGTIDQWTTFDSYFTDIADLLTDNPNIQHLDLVIYRPYGEDTPIIGLANSRGDMKYEHLSEASKEIAHELDPDFYVSSILNAPAEKYQHAYSEWLEDTLERTPVYTGSLFVAAEVQIMWLEIGGELSYQEDRYPDGSVTLTFAVSSNIGVGFDIKWTEVSAGVEGGFLVQHRFDNQSDAQAFLSKLVDRLVPKPSIDLIGLVNPLIPPVTFMPDYLGAAQILSDSRSLESSVASVGVYVSAEVDPPKWANVEADVSIGVGYGRDFVSDEHILYFEGSAELEVERLFGIDVLEGGLEFDFIGEQRWNSDGQSYVDVQFSLEIRAGTDLDQLSSLFPDVDFLIGQEVALSAYLELDDGTAIQAWENLLNPLDGSLDLVDFVDRADVTLQGSHVAETEWLDFGLGPLDVEAGWEVSDTHHLWVKPPGHGFRKVNI